MKTKYAQKRLFLVPGPTDVSATVKNALNLPIIHHRSNEFKKLFYGVSCKLQKVFITKNPVLILHGVGTAAMEASLVNLVKPQERILILQNGVFSRRSAEIADAYGIKRDILEFPNGYRVNTDTVKKTLIKKGKRYKAVFLCHVETSTGAINDVREICKLIKKYTSAFIVVDAMCSVASEKLFTDDWSIDIAITSSCKAISSVAGLSFMSVSGRVLKHLQKIETNTFYLNLNKIYEYHKQNQTPFTGSSPLFYGVDKALDAILKNGIENVWKKTARVALNARNLCKKNGFKIFPKTPANALTVIETNKADYIVKHLQKRFNIIIAEGQSELKGKLIRISNMGEITGKDIRKTFAALKSLVGENK